MNLTSAIIMLASIVATDQPVNQASQPTTYKAAYKKALQGDKPLLVLVTAQWCPPCQQLKARTIPVMEAKNGFREFHYAKVDLDVESRVARQLIETRPVPQFIIFEKHDGKWQRRFLVGYNDVANVEAFLQPSIDANNIRTANKKLAQDKR